MRRWLLHPRRGPAIVTWLSLSALATFLMAATLLVAVAVIRRTSPGLPVPPGTTPLLGSVQSILTIVAITTTIMAAVALAAALVVLARNRRRQ